MTICQIQMSLHMGGAEVLAARIARRLERKYRFVFLCLGELGTIGQRLIEDGYPVHCLGKRPGLDWRVVRRLAAVLRRERAGLVHAHQYGSFFYSCLGRYVSGPVPVLLTEHGRDRYPDPLNRRHALANRVLLRPADRLVAVGRSVRRALVDNEGFPGDRIGVVYNGVDLAPFADAGRDRGAVRRELGLGPDDFVMVQVARLNPLKDHLTAVRVLERVARVRPDARLLVVGDGDQEAGIRAFALGRGVEPNVRWLGLRDDVPRLVGAADLALLTSVSEGIPLTVIEAMGAALCVVATRVGGVPEVVRDGETGLLAPSGDDEALAERVLRLAADPGLRVRMGRAGRALALASFGEDRMVGEYERIYEEMAGAACRPRAGLAAAGPAEEVPR